MKILVTGITGLIGSALGEHLRKKGHDVAGLVRNKSRADQSTCFHWDPLSGFLDPEALSQVDGIIHLAGENIAKGRWTQHRKDLLVRSRVESTRLLAGRIQSMDHPPKFMINASAVGIYGSCGDQVVDEKTPPAKDFLGQLGVAWEQALFDLDPKKTRTIALRFGLVLSTHGGALQAMLPSFKWGAGAVLGSGRQFVPWITLDDTLRAISHCMDRPDVKGPVNCVTPAPVQFQTFARTLGRVLRRPVWMRIPPILVRTIFGEMGTATLLSSCRAHPKKLLDTGFEFHHPDLTEAFQDLLKH